MEIPRFRPDIQVLYRDNNVVQVGLSPAHAVLVRGPDIATVRNIDGTHSISAILEQSTDAARARRLIELLRSRGLLDERRRPPAQDAIARTGQLRSELSELDVRVHGGGRLGTTVALLLASEGLTRVRVMDSREVTSADVTPWGASRIDIGDRRDHVAAQLIERMHRGTVEARLRPGRRSSPSLDVVACDQVADWPWFSPQLSDDFVTTDSAHLAVACASQAAAISFVVEPGNTPCLRCYHHSHSDLDPQWPELSRQLSLRQGIDTSSLAHILTVAHATINRIQQWVVGNNLPEIEIIQRDGRGNSVPVDMHPMCGCAWSQVA